MKYEKCPDCGNDALKIYEQYEAFRVRSAKTDKILERPRDGEITCYNYFCKCGWDSGINTAWEGDE